MCEREVQEHQIVESVRDVRSQDPGIGGYKLFLILRAIFESRFVGRDKFYELLHKYGLVLRREKTRHTTDSNHNYHKYSNLIKGLILERPNQLWVADITYIDTDEGPCYLHLLTDAYTHEIIGWTFSRRLTADNTINALKQAINDYGHYGLEGLIHHSDRGSQYCCNEYIATLNSINAQISMTEDYKPTDNAVAERVNGIIKQEWLYRLERPKTFEKAQTLIAGIIKFYNNTRPHMSNGMRTPKEQREYYYRMCSLEALRLQPHG